MSRELIFLASTPILFAAGFACGRLMLPRMLRFPFRAEMVGRSVFVVLALATALRTAFVYLFAREHFDSWLTMASVAEIVLLSLGISAGYNSYTLSSPSSLKSAIKALREDGIVLANPFEAKK